MITKKSMVKKILVRDLTSDKVLTKGAAPLILIFMNRTY